MKRGEDIDLIELYLSLDIKRREIFSRMSKDSPAFVLKLTYFFIDF